MHSSFLAGAPLSRMVVYELIYISEPPTEQSPDCLDFYQRPMIQNLEASKPAMLELVYGYLENVIASTAPGLTSLITFPSLDLEIDREAPDRVRE